MKLVKLFAICALLVSSLAARDINYLKDNQQRASHWIVMRTPDEGAGCTANAISEHVLLTAEHCDIKNGELFIDHNPTPLVISEKVFDGADHMLLVIPNAHFQFILNYDPDKYKPSIQGERVYFWGNPAAVLNQYREGYETGTFMLPDDPLVTNSLLYIFAMPTVGGDSGSAILSAVDGRIVSVVTYGIEDGKFAGGYALQFTEAQIFEAKNRSAGNRFPWTIEL